MTTVGGSLGFALPPLGLEAPPMANRSTPPCWAPPDRFDGWPTPPCSPPRPPAFEGRGLLRLSLSVDVEDEGVRTGDWLEVSREDGDAVPSLESLFFLEVLLGSLPRESCGRVPRQRQTERHEGPYLQLSG